MSNSLLLIQLTMLVLAHATFIDQLLDKEWREFTKEHRKNYQDEDVEQLRYMIFNENRIKITEHNRRFANGEVSYKMAINEYSDLMSHEFIEMMTGLSYNEYEEMIAFEEGLTFISPDHVTLPNSVDWRSEGAVTGVKNQKSCGSCWAFSTTGSLEGQHFRKTGKLVSLSEQNLVDCSGSYGNKGCSGGFMTWAFKYIKDNGGIDTEVSYPYKAVNDKCKFNRATIGATVTGFVVLPSGDERKLAEAVATIGPISVGIHVVAGSFQHYHSGIYIEPKCNPKIINHAVLVVGYGSEGGRDFWLVKNSWGSSWGDKGYIKMLRNGNNQCGISSLASYPTV
ncbi:cathepsin L-like isoform X1 [Drosophila serrata]|uniref:cathepsin L-like isoform X1 n=1 Tax=Drosophila serrata TaxID=7274 RepID=UPI000A1D1C61|nr:cathepsin L-like isoform X1 [Drosophila serrata]